MSIGKWLTSHKAWVLIEGRNGLGLSVDNGPSFTGDVNRESGKLEQGYTILTQADTGRRTLTAFVF
jgi:hypothetical protein